MKNGRKSVGAGAAFILLLTVLVYIPALRGGFVFDDVTFIADNRLVKASDGLYRIWFTKETPYYYPLTWSLWWLEWHFWGHSAAGYHGVNVLLHAVNAIFVWMILRHLKIPGAWLAAVIFAVHPVNVATVAWISEQKNTLSMFFYGLAILLYLRFDEEPHWRWYGLSLTAFGLALLGKTAVVMLPLVLLACVWWLRGRLSRKDFLRSAPFFILSLVSGLVTVWFEHRALGPSPVRTASFLSRLATAGWVPWFYLYKVLVPINLTLMYPKREINPSRLVSYVPGIILVGWLVVLWWKRKAWGRPLLFGLGYFLVMLFPVLGFFDHGFYRYSLVADHWQYYSIVGVIALAVAAGQKIRNHIGERGRSVGVLAGVVAMIVLGVAAWKRSCVYADSETLWRDNVAKNPYAWMAYNNLGCALQAAGKPGDAIKQYEQALGLEPDYAEVHYNWGVALAQLGQLPEAIGQYEQALRLKPDHAETHNNLGSALARLGQLPEAIGYYEQALRLEPDYAEAHYNWGVALAQLGQMPEAIRHYEEALRTRSDYAEAHNGLGLALARVGRVPEAMAHWERALQLKPDYAGAHDAFGKALLREGDVQGSLTHFEQALKLNPDSAEVQNNLAWVLASLAPADGGDAARAVILAERACKLTGNRVAAYLDTLGAAYAAAGRFDQAIASAQKAIELARSVGQPEMIPECEARLQLYRGGNAYRQPAHVTLPRRP